MREREQRVNCPFANRSRFYDRFGEESESINLWQQERLQIGRELTRKNEEIEVESNHRCILPGSNGLA